MLDKLKEKVKRKPKEETQMERIISTLKDSLENRSLYAEDENAEPVEDMQYVNDLLNSIEKAERINREEKESKKWIKIPKLEVDGRVVSAVITAVGGITVALISYTFGHECIEYDKDGNVVPTRLFGYGPKMPNPKV